MLGHTNTRMTAHYAKLIDKCIGEQMDKLMDTFTGDSEYWQYHLAIAIPILPISKLVGIAFSLPSLIFI